MIVQGFVFVHVRDGATSFWAGALLVKPKILPQGREILTKNQPWPSGLQP
jgi:hypothetical protein